MAVIASVGSVSVGVASISIGQPGVSLGLGLGLWLGSGESGKANLVIERYIEMLIVLVLSYHKSELHCNLSVEFRMALISPGAQFIPAGRPKPSQASNQAGQR